MTMLTFIIYFTLVVPNPSGGAPITLEPEPVVARYVSKPACEAEAGQLAAKMRAALPEGRKLTAKCVQLGGPK